MVSTQISFLFLDKQTYLRKTLCKGNSKITFLHKNPVIPRRHFCYFYAKSGSNIEKASATNNTLEKNCETPDLLCYIGMTILWRMPRGIEAPSIVYTRNRLYRTLPSMIGAFFLLCALSAFVFRSSL